MLSSHAIHKSTAACNIVCTYFIVHYCGTSATDLKLMLFKILILAKYKHYLYVSCSVLHQSSGISDLQKFFFMTRRPILCTIEEHCAYEFIMHRSLPPPPPIQRST
jgi:hypothetical protein